MTPVIAGLLLAIPLAQWTANAAAGGRMRAHKLLLTPEEDRPPDILQRANALAGEPARSDTGGALERLVANPALLAAHRAMLPQPTQRKAGEINVARLVALAKLEDCTTIQDAAGVLDRIETMALLTDARALEQLVTLEQASDLKNVK